MMVKSEQNNKKKKKTQTTPQTQGQAQKPEAEEAVVSQLDLRFRDEIANHPGGENIRRCFACGTCAAGCPVTEIDSEYNCRRIIRQILMGMRDEVLSSPLIWLCLVCYRCYVRCPQQVNFTDIMRVLRYLSVKEKRVSPDVFEQISKLDRFSQVVRHDMVRSFFENKGVSLDDLENHVTSAMKEALTK
ncbi:MAG: 4Fe-4S dicluster domain-containing protein [Planctomycetota bacterium]|jgi:heterodisulfide reductase subunit C